MKIVPVSAAVGAMVSDIDLRRIDDDDVAELEAAWAEHGVLFFRDQELTPDDHIAFAERFAPIDVNRFFQPVESHPRIAQVLKEPDQTANIGGGWHTWFLSVGAAYEALSDGFKATLETLRAYHTNEHVFGADALAARSVGDRLGNPEGVGGAEHPVVIRHPVTGRKLLYVNLGFTTHFVGWTREESRPILEYLYHHCADGDFGYRWSWEPGSVAMWDNRSTWHWAVNDYQGHRRLMHRITLQGEPIGA
jgi:taurine dioxygenase